MWRNLINLLLVFFLPSAALAGFQVKKQVKDFAIEGNKFETLLAQIQHQSPPTQKPEHRGKWQGWLVTWDYHFRVSSLSCAIESFNIHVKTEVPNALWKNYDEASPELKTRWDKYQYDLAQYQQAHIDLAIEAGKEVEKQLIKLGTSANCDLLANSATKKTQKIIDKYKEKHQTYDQQTHYGDDIIFAEKMD